MRVRGTGMKDHPGKEIGCSDRLRMWGGLILYTLLLRAIHFVTR